MASERAKLLKVFENVLSENDGNIQKVHELEAKLKENVAKIAALESSNSTMTQKLISLETRNKKLIQKLRDSIASNRVKAQQIEMMQPEINEMKNLIATLEHTNEESVKENESLQAEYLQKLHDSSRSNKKQVQLTELEDKFKKMTQDLKIMKSENEKVIQRNVSIEIEKNHLVRFTATLRACNDSNVNQIAQLESLNKILSDSNDVLLAKNQELINQLQLASTINDENVETNSNEITETLEKKRRKAKKISPEKKNPTRKTRNN